MIIKALKTIGALFLLMYVIASGFVVDNVLFQIKPQNITDVICCIMGFGFIVDFLLRLCLVKNKLYFISGYATLPISRRKMLWLSVFLNSLSIYNVLGVILLAPTLFHIVASSHQAFVFLLMILTLALFNGAVVRAIKSFETMGKVLSGGIAIAMYALLGYGLTKSECGEILSVGTVALLGLALSVMVLTLAIEYNSAKRMLRKSLGEVGTQHVTFRFFQGRGNMFPILLYLRNKNMVIMFIYLLSILCCFFAAYKIDTSLSQSVIFKMYFIIMAVNFLPYQFNLFTVFASEYMDGLVTMKKDFVRDMIHTYDRYFSISALIIATIIVCILGEYMLILSLLLLSVTVLIPMLLYEVSLASKRLNYYSKLFSVRVVDGQTYISKAIIFGFIALLSVLCLCVSEYCYCVIILSISFVGLIFRKKVLDHASDRFWRNRHKILGKMREE